MNANTHTPLVLVVDDNEMNLKLMKGMMAYAGYDLVVARSAEEGLAKAEKVKADIVLMDIQLPEMNGYEATQALRENNNYKEVPILAISGYGMKEDEDRLLRVGFNGYLQKPIKLQDLLETLNKYLNIGDS